MTWHRRLVDGLAAQLAAEHPSVDRIETHISSLLLANGLVFKLKKPLDLGFLDFTGLDRRRIACEDELRLNRRLAPSIYQAVVRLTGQLEAPQLDGTGKVLDYAVRMSRFSQQQRLDRVLPRGELAPEHLEQLAETIAAFHNEAASAELPDWLADPEPLIEPLLANLQQLEGLGAKVPESVTSYLLGTIPALRQRLRRRLAAGLVREGHGDLHLENIALIDDRAVAFDCIEFDARLRWMDVMADIAFLLMDLDDRGASPLATRFLNRYLDVSGDHAGVTDLRLFQCYRALIRAKIHTINLNDQSRPAAQRQASVARRDRYLELAERYCQPQAPQLITTCGLSASGKSTAALALAEEIGAIRLRSDVERKRLFGLDALARTDSPVAGALYGQDAGRATYTALAAKAGQLLAAGWSVIVDAACLKRTERDRFRQLAASHGCPWRLLYCDAPQQTLRQRLQLRAAKGRDPSEADAAVLDFQLQQFERPSDEERQHRIRPGTETP
ncbi:AAA family ATPase [Methylonatrum kenyense]|uniref:bifunctional aminoglycoside phosphotransferase/ATP-binding protein n=1 Tax=Methylonatrum kenyense TaxID=455253 RepID=UPI0020BEDC43|nr:bifunctional aminoglycoside phosphotransferase/ATP-binding protein [Methylonatrum kenyense]MCK8516834.1 AAA family ATPase [Methylonatrum kenyense]